MMILLERSVMVTPRTNTTDVIALANVSPVGRKVDGDDLVGVTEIAERLGGIPRDTVHQWRRRYDDFPEPIAVLTQALVFVWADVERWADQNGLPRGGPGRPASDSP